LGGVNSPDSRQTLIECLRQAPERFALSLAAALTQTGEGADALLQAVVDGLAPAALLTQQAIKDTLLAVRAHQAGLVARLTASLSPRSERLQKIVQERLADFPSAEASVERGATLFQVHCAVCHSVGGTGGRVGPELDGIGHRGSERLCEDVLDPNRNVDRVFRYSLITLKDGSVMAGLFRREEGAVLVFVDATGKELTVEKASIEKRTEADTSLMPEIFADLLPPADFHHLLAFLLAQSSRAP
jgi:putative heme-binding domain-containing protein